MTGGGSYAPMPAGGSAVAAAGTGGDDMRVTLFSVQNNEYGDWPVQYGSNGFVAGSSVYWAHTRTNQVHYIYSWLSYGYRGRARPDVAMLHICTNSPATVSNNGMKDKWDGSGSLLDADKLGIIKTIGIYMPSECEIAQGWISATEHPDCYAVIEMICDTPYEDEYTKLSTFNWTTHQLSYYENVVSSAPTLTYDQSANAVTVGTSKRGRRILEFHDINSVSPTGITDEETLMSFYFGSMINLESTLDYSAYYDDARNARLRRWKPGRYSVSVTDTVGDSLYSYVSGAVDNAIAQVNGVMSEFGITLFRNDGYGSWADIPITYGTMRSLWGEYVGETETNYFHGGRWEHTSFDGYYVTGAEIGISREAHYYTTFSQVCFEEIIECMGCGYDQWEYPLNTTTLDMGGPWNPDYVTDKDADMLRLVYSNAVSAGDDATTVAMAHNIPKGVKLLSTSRADSAITADLSFLEPDHTYEIRVWVIDYDGTMSQTSGWIEITTPNKPPKWYWTSIGPSGSVYRASAREWNVDFVNCVNAVRQAQALPLPAYGAFADDPAVSGQPMRAKTFNHAAYAISAMYPEWQRAAVMSELVVYPGEVITVAKFNKLRDRLNACIP